MSSQSVIMIEKAITLSKTEREKMDIPRILKQIENILREKDKEFYSLKRWTVRKTKLSYETQALSLTISLLKKSNGGV